MVLINFDDIRKYDQTTSSNIINEWQTTSQKSDSLLSIVATEQNWEIINANSSSSVSMEMNLTSENSDSLTAGQDNSPESDIDDISKINNDDIMKIIEEVDKSHLKPKSPKNSQMMI